MPYPFAHPAAVLPLARPLGRFAVPSALAVGSIAPDLWYFVPLVGRPDSHSIGGLAWFCLPAVPWRAVIVSLLAGTLTHFAWDALTHSYDDALQRHNWLQHASTALGTLVLGWWSWRKLRPAPDLLALRQFLRTGGLAAMQALGAALLVYCVLFQRKMFRRAA